MLSIIMCAAVSTNVSMSRSECSWLLVIFQGGFVIEGRILFWIRWVTSKFEQAVSGVPYLYAVHSYRL